MSESHEGGLIEQLKPNMLHKFEATSREQFEELMKVMNHMSEEKAKEEKLKEELRKIKGPKKKLEWKKK